MPKTFAGAGDPTGLTYTLEHSPEATLAVADGEVVGGDEPIELAVRSRPASPTSRRRSSRSSPTTRSSGPSDSIGTRWRHCSPSSSGSRSASTASSPAFTGVQLPGVLDDLYADALAVDAARRDRDRPGLDVAPVGADRAVGVAAGLGLRRDRRPGASSPPSSTRPTARGAWTAPRWATSTAGRSRSTRRRRARSRSTRSPTPTPSALTTNSARSVVVNLDDESLQPEQWAETPAPVVERPVDRAIYELHVRDFSITDESVPEAERGTYRAFTRDSDGRGAAAPARRRRHQHGAPAADVRHRHHRGEPRRPGGARRATSRRSGPHPLSSRRASTASATSTASTGATTRSTSRRPRAPTRWTPNGGARVAEFREMVGALHGMGLQVVLDEVYNHTAASGQGEKSVLDRIVPGYYQRLNAAGNVETSTCCQNVATEHEVAEKLMVDSVVLVGQGVQGRRLPLRPHGPPLEAEHAGRSRGARRAHAQGGRRRREGRVPLRRGLELRRGREQRALRAGHAGPARRHRHRHVQRPAARRRARRQPGRCGRRRSTRASAPASAPTRTASPIDGPTDAHARRSRPTWSSSASRATCATSSSRDHDGVAQARRRVRLQRLAGRLRRPARRGDQLRRRARQRDALRPRRCSSCRPTPRWPTACA